MSEFAEHGETVVGVFVVAEVCSVASSPWVALRATRSGAVVGRNDGGGVAPAPPLEDE